MCPGLFFSGKLLSRSQKVAFTLLNKFFGKGNETSLKVGDRIALVYPNNDPINFLCAFYGCLFAGIVPVPIEVPLTRRVRISDKLTFCVSTDFKVLVLKSHLSFA